MSISPERLAKICLDLKRSGVIQELVNGLTGLAVQEFFATQPDEDEKRNMIYRKVSAYADLNQLVLNLAASLEHPTTED